MVPTKGKLTPRQKQILLLAIRLTDRRRIAETLGIAYGTVKNHLEDIRQRLNLEDRFIQFSELAIGDEFIHNGIRYKKVPHAADRYGGYNTQDKDGKRSLFLRAHIVERIRP